MINPKEKAKVQAMSKGRFGSLTYDKIENYEYLVALRQELYSWLESVDKAITTFQKGQSGEII